MIIHLKESTSKSKAEEIAKELKAILVNNAIITTSKLKELPKHLEEYANNIFVFDSDIQLASKEYTEKRIVQITDSISIGGNSNNSLIITGPCSIESEEQIEEVAQFCVKEDIKVLRAGCYKPRTSPYSFQGLGLTGLKLLAKMRDKYGLKIITEVRDATHVNDVIEHTDIIQVGAKAMYDHGILRACGSSRKSVLLKRGFGTTLQEFVQAAEFILSGGNENVILCERGIRTFETKTRFTLDLCSVAYLKEHTNLPIIVDPSHAMGYRYGVADLSRASMAMGVEGLIIETHPNPKVALSDAAQQLNFESFSALHSSIKQVAQAVGKKIV